MFQLAEHLNIKVEDIMSMSRTEYAGWNTYFELKNERSK